MRTIGLCAAALALIVSGAIAAPQASTPPRHTPAAPPARQQPSQQPRLNDTQLEAAIRAKLAKSKIHEDKFTVRVQGGVAHIDGKTDVLQHKGVATRMAKTAGAAMVDNRVQVSQAAKDKAAGNLATGRRRVQVKRGDARSDERPAK